MHDKILELSVPQVRVEWLEPAHVKAEKESHVFRLKNHFTTKLAHKCPDMRFLKTCNGVVFIETL